VRDHQHEFAMRTLRFLHKVRIGSSWCHYQENNTLVEAVLVWGHCPADSVRFTGRQNWRVRRTLHFEARCKFSVVGRILAAFERLLEKLYEQFLHLIVPSHAEVLCTL